MFGSIITAYFEHCLWEGWKSASKPRIASSVALEPTRAVSSTSDFDQTQFPFFRQWELHALQWDAFPHSQRIALIQKAVVGHEIPQEDGQIDESSWPFAMAKWPGRTFVHCVFSCSLQRIGSTLDAEARRVARHMASSPPTAASAAADGPTGRGNDKPFPSTDAVATKKPPLPDRDQSPNLVAAGVGQHSRGSEGGKDRNTSEAPAKAEIVKVEGSDREDTAGVHSSEQTAMDENVWTTFGSEPIKAKVSVDEGGADRVNPSGIAGPRGASMHKRDSSGSSWSSSGSSAGPWPHAYMWPGPLPQYFPTPQQLQGGMGHPPRPPFVLPQGIHPPPGGYTFTGRPVGAASAPGPPSDSVETQGSGGSDHLPSSHSSLPAAEPDLSGPKVFDVTTITPFEQSLHVEVRSVWLHPLCLITPSL